MFFRFNSYETFLLVEKTMKFLKFLLPLAMVTVGATGLRAASGSPNTDEPGAFTTVHESRESDELFVRDYIKSKRTGSIADKASNLNLSGEIRAEWDHGQAKTRGIKQRGSHTRKLFPNSILPSLSKSEYRKLGVPPGGKRKFPARAAYRAAKCNTKAPYGINEFSVEADIMLDYVADRTWGSIKLQFDNPAGISEVDRKTYSNDAKNILYGSGKMGNVALRRAYIGANLYDEDLARVDFELGRRRLYDVFDSRIQFYSLFDGALLRYSNSFEGVTDFAIKAAAFVVDSTVNHYGYVGEIDFLNLADSGLDFKYSIIDWEFHHKNRFGRRHPLGSRFVNSQFTLGYTFTPDSPQFKTQFYGAYLINHAADKTKWTHHKKANEAYYVGVTVGKVVKQGDWAADLCYQWVQAQAIAERDVRGIARDNPRNISFYNRRSQGFANYKGWKLDAFYALTDNWTLNGSFEQIREENKAIGGRHKSHMLCLTSIYAF